MYSSSASTASTAPIDRRWALPVPKETLKDCYLNKSYYRPDEEIFDFWKYESASAKIPICEKKDKPEIQDFRCVENGEIIKEFMAETFAKDTRTLEDIYKEDMKIRKQNIKFSSKLQQNHIKIWNIDKEIYKKQIPFAERFCCYPRIIIDFGHDVVHYKKIMDFVANGIKGFHFDLRFQTEKLRDKNIKHIKYAMKLPNPQGISETLFATFFSITGRKLQTGENQFGQDIYLERDSIVILTADRYFSNKSNHKVIYINFANYVPKIMKHDIIEIGDKIKVKVQKEYINSVKCIVVNDGLLKSRSKIKLPTERTLSDPPQITIEEEIDITQAFFMGCDFIVIPYPFSAQVITFIHWVTAAQHRSSKIYAKFDLTEPGIIIIEEELRAAVDQCIGFYLYLDKFEEITPNIKTIFKVALEQQKAILWAGIFDKPTDKLFIPDDDELKKYMFLYPEILSIKTNDSKIKINLRNFIRYYYPEMSQLCLQMSCNPMFKISQKIEYLFLRYMIISSLKTRCTCIIVTNNSGKAVSLITKFRPIIPIITSFCDAPTARRIKLLRNAYSLVYYNAVNCSWNDELELRLAFCVEFAKDIGAINKSDPFIYCFDSKRGIKFPDSYRVLTLDNVSIN